MTEAQAAEILQALRNIPREIATGNHQLGLMWSPYLDWLKRKTDTPIRRVSKSVDMSAATDVFDVKNNSDLMWRFVWLSAADPSTNRVYTVRHTRPDETGTTTRVVGRGQNSGTDEAVLIGASGLITDATGLLVALSMIDVDVYPGENLRLSIPAAGGTTQFRLDYEEHQAARDRKLWKQEDGFPWY